MRSGALARLSSLASLVFTVALAPSCSSSSSGAPPPAAPPFGDGVAVTGHVKLDHLSGPVDMVRDAHGMVHVYATSMADAMRVQGYQVARDRTAQLELIRRNAEGRLAEVFAPLSPDLIDTDITMRTIGLRRVAQATYDALAPGDEQRVWLDAYADGISQFNARAQTGDESIPTAMLAFPPKALAPWTGVDVLAVGRFQSQNLAYTAPSEVDDTGFVEAARAAFAATSADPAAQARAGFLRDVARFAPIDPTTVLGAFPADPSATARTRPGVALTMRAPAPAHRTSVDLLRDARAWAQASRRINGALGRGVTGSNNWVVGPSLSATGHAMVANDPHLDLQAPATFWMLHVNVTSDDPSQQLDFAGMAFPGILGIILGANQRVAWGATTAYYDVTDVFQETLTPDGSGVVFNGAVVPLQKIREEILISGGAPLEYDVLVVPHHGPIIPTIVNHQIVPPDPAKGALSIQWTGTQPTKDVAAVAGYLRAKTVDDARDAVRDFAVGAQNWVFADTAGDIYYSSHARIPVRDRRAYTWDPATFTGTLPCFVQPGDGTAEWTGAFVPDGFVPHVKNPAKGYVVTANNDQVGTTLDDDPSNDTLPDGSPTFLSCFYDPGFRAGRITRLIEQKAKLGKLQPADLQSIQADASSNVGRLLAPKIAEALGRAEDERQTPGTHPDLTAVVADPRYAAAGAPVLRDLFVRWETDADYDTAAGVSLDDGSPLSDAKEAAASKATLLFNAWLVSMIQLTFADELAAMQWGAPTGDFDLRQSLLYMMTIADPKGLATYQAATGDSAIYDDMKTPAVESRDERTITALLAAVDFAKARLGADDGAWRWGKVHTITFAPLVSLWGALAIPPAGDPAFPNGFPRHGEDWVVDVAGYSYWTPDPKTQDFTYTHGPVQRFVADLDPQGPRVLNVLPGGEVWDNTSPHFRDEAELWRRNQTHAVPTTKDAIAAGADEHVIYEQ